MVVDDDLDGARREIPEEFWGDFAAIRRLLDAEIAARVAAVATLGTEVAHLSDKELGLALRTLPEEPRRYLFSWRKQPDLLADAKTRGAILRDIKPKANALAGYTPFYALQRLVEDE